MAGKPIRLGKAAGELNVGLPTLVEFLASKGVNIDSSPNTKLEPEHFELLCQEFAADQSLKEQAKGATLRERMESVSLKDNKPEPQPTKAKEEDEEEEINLEEIKRNVLSPDIESSAKDVQVNVVGKIDLDQFQKKPKKEDPPVTPQEPEVQKEKPVEIETIKTERTVLSGPTVLGKIELPVEKPKSSPKENDDEPTKKKRKRIKKIEAPGSAQKPGTGLFKT
ncbi:MAG: translation initiation factor IF-2, partial [Flavobacteriales bacterium]